MLITYVYCGLEASKDTLKFNNGLKIETAPTFNRIIYPFIPMTYTVEGLRMIISGINSERLIKISSILLLFLIAFYIGGYLLRRAFKQLKGQILV